jgi:predicted enzyme related to lactoylglutathione lyase
MPPTIGNAKICYLEIPASDIQRSVAFYESVFGWNIRHRGDGSFAFDDGVGEVSGTWVVGRAPSVEVGILIYIMVDSVAATLESITAHGGVVVQPIGGDAPEITARFRDPAGNIFGLYQEPQSREGS